MNQRQRRYLQAMGIQWYAPITPHEPPVDAMEALPADEFVGAMAAQAIPLDESTEAMAASVPDDPHALPPLEAYAADISAALVDDDVDFTVPAEVPRSARIATLDWDALNQEVQTCSACELHTTRQHAVFGVGNRKAQWMIVGEAPGADEDRLGEPFVGRSGKLLDLMLQALSLDRQQVFITNVIKCRPPQNRDPNANESISCRPFLERQLALLQPRIILAVGRVAAQNLLNTQQPVGKLRNRVHRFGATQTPLVVTYHPAYLLRSPREKRRAWQDLQLARRALAGGP